MRSACPSFALTHALHSPSPHVLHPPTTIPLAQGLAVTLVTLGALYARWRVVVNPAAVYRQAMVRLNTHPGVLEVGRGWAGVERRGGVGNSAEGEGGKGAEGGGGVGGRTSADTHIVHHAAELPAASMMAVTLVTQVRIVPCQVMCKRRA